MRATKQRLFVLSLDGGGLRGIIPAMILDDIEKRTGKKIARSFDLIAGTSTGGILGLALTVPDSSQKEPKYSAAALVSLYKELGARVFGPKMRSVVDDPGKPWYLRLWAWVEGLLLKPKYKTNGLDTILAERFGEVMLSQSVSDVLITSYDLNASGPKLFKSHKAKTGDAENYRMADVARATSAAPTFFSPLQIDGTQMNLVDGGLVLNDPSLAAYVEAITNFVSTPDTEVILVSIGTGASSQPIEYEESKNWGAANWLKPVIYTAMDGVSVTTSYMLQSLAGTQHAKLRYFRLNPMVNPEQSSMDDPTHMPYWESVATNFLKENDAVLEEVATALSQPTLYVPASEPELSV